MSKTKSISDLVTELQQENESLQGLKKLFNQACKMEFGYDVAGLHQQLEKARLFEQRRGERQGQESVSKIGEV